MIVGITGKSGSGKSYISKLLNKNGNYEVIDADLIAHQVLGTEAFKKYIIDTYGTEIVSDSGIDRKKLGAILFTDKEKMDAYNASIWKHMEIIIDNIIKKKKNVIIDWALLPITKYFKEVDVKILVKTDDIVRKDRVIKRDNIDESYFHKRDMNALSYNEKDFDIILVSDDTLISQLDKTIDLIERSGKMKICLYAGSFDPFTNGHLHVIRKASVLFDKVIIGIANNPDKKRYYDKEIMEKAINETLKDEGLDNCFIVCYDGLTTDVALKYNATYLVRGIRNGMDYAYEENIAELNYELSEIDTIYLRAGKVGSISSSFVRELIKNDKDISKYVPKSIVKIKNFK